MPGPSFLAIDIETVPDRALWEAPRPLPGEPEVFPPIPVHRVVCIGGLSMRAGECIRLGVLGEGLAERDMLAAFAEAMEVTRPRLVTWNGRGFDLPVIFARSMILGIPQSWYHQGRPDYRYRYKTDAHLDLKDQLADHGACPSWSLDMAARSCGLPGKGLGPKGSDVEAMMGSGRSAEVAAYCLSDVAQTALLGLRFLAASGTLSAVEMAAASDSILTRLHADPRTAALAATISGGAP